MENISYLIKLFQGEDTGGVRKPMVGINKIKQEARRFGIKIPKKGI